MSYFSIPTLRANRKKLLTAPVITITDAANPQFCIPEYNVTILGSTGSEIYYNIGANYPDPYCGDTTYSQYSANSTVILANVTGSIGNNQVKAISCFSGSSSSVSVENFGGGSCLANVSAPTIAYTQTSNISVSFTVTAESCGKTYIQYGIGDLNEASPSSYQNIINTFVGTDWSFSGVIEGNDSGQAEENDYFISAVTYFDREGCDITSSTVTSIVDGPILD